MSVFLFVFIYHLSCDETFCCVDVFRGRAVVELQRLESDSSDLGIIVTGKLKRIYNFARYSKHDVHISYVLIYYINYIFPEFDACTYKRNEVMIFCANSPS